MVVLVSFLLVLAAAVTLVVGLLQSGLTLIYLSIGCSVVAGLVLAVAVLRGRPEPKAAPVAPPRPVSTPASVPAYSRFESEPEPADESWKVDTTPAPAARRFGRPAAVAIEESEPEPEPEPSPIAGYARRAAGAGASTSPAVISREMPVPAAHGAFPIADFDTLRAPELLRRVDDLGDVAALEEVRAAEAAGKNRVSIISRIDARLETLREPGWDIDEATWEGDEPPAAGDVPADDFDDDTDLDLAPVAAGADFPIANYDSLRVGQILPQLRDLDDAELDEVRQYEAAGKARSGILDRIEFLSSGGAQPAAAAPSPAAPAAKAAGSTSIAAAVAAAKAKQAKKG
ncbi:MAG: hypothetical protein QOG43_1516 [Actinomycetota bacterium]|nr:hypothetical protein [Actinomycetota bacterium]